MNSGHFLLLRDRDSGTEIFKSERVLADLVIDRGVTTAVSDKI
jgi:hypothetical protein